MSSVNQMIETKISKIRLATILVAVAATLAIACSSEDPTPTSVPGTPTSEAAQPTAMTETAGTVMFGTLMDTTGDLGVFGPPMQKAVDLAVELINEGGGVNGGTLEVIHRDSATSEQVATDAASALVNVDGVNAIVGSLSSGVTIAVAESVTIPNSKLLISPASSSPAITSLQDNDFVFRTNVSDALQGVIIASLASNLGYENVATLYINNQYGEGLTSVFEENFEALGGTVSAAVPIESGQVSYISELRRAAEGGATVLMAIGYPESASVFLRESVEGDFFDDYLLVDGTKSQEMLDEIGASNFDGIFGTAPGGPETPTRSAFLDLYSSRTDGNADALFIAEAFDAAVLIALAMEHAGSDDAAAVKDSLRDVSNAPGERVGPGDITRALDLIRNGQDIDYVGASGEQEFDENGDVLNTIEVWTVEDGKIVSTGIFASPGDEVDVSAMVRAEAPTGDPIRIGTLMDTTGDLAAFGPPMITATDLVATLVNEAGGIDGRPVEMVHRDSGTSAQIATDAASGLVNVEGVEAIVGSLSSGVSIAVAESVTIPNGAVLVSPASTSPAISSLDDSDLVFRTTVSDALQGVIAAELATQLGYENVATMYINNAYGEGLSTIFAENFERLGGTVSEQVPIEGGQASYASELRRASQGGATVLLAMSYAETAGVYLREAVEGGFFEEFMFVDGTKSQDLMDSVGADNFEGNYGTAPGAPSTPTQEAFIDLYSTKTDGDPASIFISEAFDAAAILALAIAHAGSEDGDAIKQSIREVSNAPGEKVGPGDIGRALQLISQGQDIDYVGAAGEQDFDANGDVKNTIEVWRIVNGQITSTGVFALPGQSIEISTEPARIGTLMDATGDLGVFGPPMQLAVDLAVDLVNEAGGVNGGALEVIHRDSATSEQVAIDAASALVNIDGVSAIVGSLSSGVSLAVAQSVTIPNGTALISPASTSPAITSLDDNDFMFRTTVSDALQGVIAASMANELGYDNVATLYVNNPYGEGLSSVFQDSFESLGGTVSAAVPIESGQVSYLSELRRASEGGATVLMAIGYPESASVFLRESVEGAFFDEYMFVDGTKSQEMFDEIGASNFEGSYGTGPGGPDTPTRTAFLDLYSSRTDGNPDSLFISEAFDAAAIIALAIEHANSSDPGAVRDSLRTVANAPGERIGPGELGRGLELIRAGIDVDYVGASGEQELDENGDVLNTIEIWTIADGKIESTGIFASPGDEIDIEPTSMMSGSAGGGDASTGTYVVGDGSTGLFKVDENLRGADIVVSLQTNALTGQVDMGAGIADLQIDLHSLQSDQARRDRYVREQMFPAQPVATVSFSNLGDVPESFFGGGIEHTTSLDATVNVNGRDATLPFDITARLDNGTDLVILGTTQFTWDVFGMEAPTSPFFQVEDLVTVEVLLYTSLAQ